MHVFSFIQPGHSFYPLIKRLRESISSSQWATFMVQNIDQVKTIVRADLSQSFVPGVGWELSKLYWSFQYWDDRNSSEFQALTFFYRGKKKDTIELCVFPNDRSLRSIKPFFEKKRSLSERFKVLQYIPSLRLTALLADPNSPESAVVCKFKKKSRYQAAYEKLVHVFEAGCQSPLSSSLAAPIRIDRKNRMFFQKAKSGKKLSASINATNFKNHIRTLGSLHYDLHQLNAKECAAFIFGVFLNELKKSVSWIILFFPAQGELFEEVRDTLLKQIPILNPVAYVYCHGDFLCSQILIKGEQWSVVDFDLAMRGDPYLEMGRLIASLKYDVPFFEEELRKLNNMKSSCLDQAIEIYISGYEQRSARKLNRKRLLWYQMWYEVFYVSLMLKKDRFNPTCYHYACGLLNRLRSEFLKIKSSTL